MALATLQATLAMHACSDDRELRGATLYVWHLNVSVSVVAASE